MRHRFAVAILLALSPSLFAQSASQIQSALIARAYLLKSWMANEDLVAAARDQNAKHVPLTEVQRIHKQWSDHKQQNSAALTTGGCADRLRKLIAPLPEFEYAYVMDGAGTVVCATFVVDDYWQGDRTNFQRAFNGGKGAAYVDRPRLDATAGKPVAQISVPLLDGSSAIGTLTVAVDPRRVPMPR